MRILGIILARGGSKRLPGKNVKLLGSRPLIAWTLQTASKSGVFDEMLVSTDDEGIAKVAREWGGSVPWLRPIELASDTSTSIDAILHALEWFEEMHGTVDGVMLLQPTSPFRSVESIQRAVKLFSTNNLPSVVSVSPANEHPAWCFRIEDGLMKPMQSWKTVASRSQDLTPIYVLNGMIYIATPQFLRQNRSFLSEETSPLVITDPAEALDIDTEWDWRIAEQLIS
jgi:CMP-N,N'-diacetyllegionaminic acid synthase